MYVDFYHKCTLEGQRKRLGWAAVYDHTQADPQVLCNSVRRTTVSQWSTDQRHPRQRHTADQYLRCFPGNNVGPVSPRGMWFPAPSRTPRRAQAFMPAPLLASFFTSANYFYLLESQLSYLEGGKPCFHKALVRLNEISVSGS